MAREFEALECKLEAQLQVLDMHRVLQKTPKGDKRTHHRTLRNAASFAARRVRGMPPSSGRSESRYLREWTRYPMGKAWVLREGNGLDGKASARATFAPSVQLVQLTLQL
jgi:hypothetical protein